MIFYHGSPLRDLNVLRPFLSEHQKPLVYLSTRKPVAAFYLCKRPYMWHTYGFLDDGTPVYTETYPGQLEDFYGDLAGALYTCEGEYPALNPTGIACAAVSEEPVPVSACEPVDDALELLLRFEREGSLHLRRYETLTADQRAANDRMMLSAIRHHRLLEGVHPLAAFVRERFPSLWAQAEREGEARESG